MRIEGVPGDVAVRRVPRARRMRLRLDSRAGTPVLVLPPRVSLASGLAFAADHAAWLRSHIERIPARVPFASGVEIPFEGEARVLAAEPGASRGVRLVVGAILVGGPERGFARRLLEWLKGCARERIEARARIHAAALGRAVARIGLRDPRGRWGSCSRRGDLSISWRLILAPPFVLDYVVAHEVAHLAHMNHSRAFWRALARLAPDHARAQDWLRRHGADLHRFG